MTQAFNESRQTLFPELPPIVTPAGWEDCSQHGVPRYIHPVTGVGMGVAEELIDGKRVRFVRTHSPAGLPSEADLELARQCFLGDVPVLYSLFRWGGVPGVDVLYCPELPKHQRDMRLAESAMVLDKVRHFQNAPSARVTGQLMLRTPPGWRRVDQNDKSTTYIRDNLRVVVSDTYEDGLPIRCMSVSDAERREPTERSIRRALEAFLSDEDCTGNATYRFSTILNGPKKMAMVIRDRKPSN